MLPFAPLAAQDSIKTDPPLTQQQDKPYRDQHKARIFATLLPGAGYAYTGEYLHGYGTWVVTASGLMVGPIIFSSACNFFTLNSCNGEGRLVNVLTGSIMIVGSLHAWISSVRDAPKSAERANERHRRRELKVHPIIGVPESHNRVNAGFSVAW
jgi:hypothetical protein